MYITRSPALNYCYWFVDFAKRVLGVGNGKLLLFYGFLGAMKDFAGVAAFFIPLKVVMVLANPDILSSISFTSNPIDIESFILYSGISILFLMLVSLSSHILLTILIHKSVKQSWVNNSVEFPSRAQYQNLYQSIVDNTTQLLIIVVGSIVVLILDKYLFIPIIFVIFTCVAVSSCLSRYSKSDLHSSSLKKTRLIFKLCADLGFLLTFMFIILEYYFNEDLNVLFTLLAVLISRIIFSRIQQLFIKQSTIFENFYINQ
jgi:hypothetical protein